jgi:hypothetical protein
MARHHGSLPPVTKEGRHTTLVMRQAAHHPRPVEGHLKAKQTSGDQYRCEDDQSPQGSGQICY